MVEQDFYVGSDDAAAVFVDTVMQFFLNLVETVENSLVFTLRHMQGFVYLVGEESVFLHLAGKVCTAYKVWVEQKGVTLRMQRLAAIANTANLSWSHEYKSPFLIVISVAPVSDLSVNFLFKEYGIEAKAFAAMFQHLYL